MKRCTFILARMAMVCILVCVGFFSCPMIASGENSLLNNYKFFVESGEYDRYVRAGNPEFTEMFYERDKSMDSFAFFDFNSDRVPELLIRSDFGLEQADVFSAHAGKITWEGTIGGDNFFNWFVEYKQNGFDGKLYVFSGGPAM